MDRRKLIKAALLLEIAKAINLIRVISEKRIKKRRYAVREILKCRQREGTFHNLIPRMRLCDRESFKNFHRMDPATFDELLSLLGPHLRKIPTRHVEEISAGERLSITLRYLASGDSMKSVGFYGFRVGASTTSYIINETCQLIWEKLSFVFPQHSEEMWRQIANDFFSVWNFPNCLGAIDGKHIIIQALPNHHTLKFNYKNSHSLVLMAVADAAYKFLLVDIGALGRNSDGGEFRNSNFDAGILNNPSLLKLPHANEQPGTDFGLPFVFVGDDAFPLRKNLMRPYPRRNSGNLPFPETNFNLRLSRARQVVENAFGILASRFHVYRKPIIAKKETVVNITKATVCLHNWLRDKTDTEYFSADLVDRHNEDGSIVPGSWRSTPIDGMQSLERTNTNNSDLDAVQIRQLFTNYFM